MTSATHTSSVHQIAADVTCPTCRRTYDDTASCDAASEDARFPVLLIPCSCTVCRSCIRTTYHADLAQFQVSTAGDSISATQQQHQQQQQQPQPRCPQCSATIEITQFNEAALALVRTAATQVAAASRYNAGGGAAAAWHGGAADSSSFLTPAGSLGQHLAYDTVDTVSVAASMGPLDPAVRLQLYERCTRPEDAARAEQVARSCGSLRRIVELSKVEFDAAKQERDSASQTVDTKEQTCTVLQNEAKQLDEQIKKLTLDRQVVLHQLQHALTEHAGSVRYRTECDMRLLECQRKIAAESKELETRVKMVQQLAPGVNL